MPELLELAARLGVGLRWLDRLADDRVRTRHVDLSLGWLELRWSIGVSPS